MTDDRSERLPPQDVDAEVAVLGSMLNDKDASDQVLRLLHKGQFYLSKHQHIFDAIATLRAQNQPPDFFLVKSELERKGVLADCGGADYVGELRDSVATAANAEHYARIVREKALRRDVIRLAASMSQEAFDSREPSDVLLDRIEARLFDLMKGRLSNEAVALSELLKQAFEIIDASRKGEREGALDSILTNFYDLDRITQGFRNSGLVIIAGRPGMGKTSLALNLFTRLGVYNGKRGVFFSLEMPAIDLVLNLLCSMAKVNSFQVRGGQISRDDEKKLYDAGDLLVRSGGLFIDDSPAITLLDIRAKSRLLRAKENIDFVIIDYLQLIEDPSPPENRQEAVAKVSRGLKGLARELKIPVVALAQLSRDVEKRESRKPRLSDLRESGAIEQDADLVLMLYREGYYKEQEGKPTSDEEKRKAEVIVAKNRHGPTGAVPLAYFAEYMSFENLGR